MHGAMDGGSGLPLVAVHGGDSAMNGAWRLRNGSDWWIYEVAEEMRVEEMAWAIRRQWGSLPWTVEARRRVVMCSSGRRPGRSGGGVNGVVAAREQSAVAGREGVRMERKCGTEGKESGRWSHVSSSLHIIAPYCSKLNLKRIP